MPYFLWQNQYSNFLPKPLRITAETALSRAQAYTLPLLTSFRQSVNKPDPAGKKLAAMQLLRDFLHKNTTSLYINKSQL